MEAEREEREKKRDREMSYFLETERKKRISLNSNDDKAQFYTGIQVLTASQNDATEKNLWKGGLALCCQMLYIPNKKSQFG
jgi:hypothetical protein